MRPPRHIRSETLVDGIERITYSPKVRRFLTPLLFVHGMWHGAWVWRDWQKQLADRGWESHAISLPGHGASPPQGSVRFATMGKYLRVLAREIARTEPRPVVIGHSMGGALIQWYLRKVADDLPAAIPVAGWTAQSTFRDGLWPLVKRDPLGVLMIAATLSSDPFVRNPRRVAQTLLSPGSTVDPAALEAKLCEESALVLAQHNPPFWRPKPDVATPMLWIAAGADAVVTEPGARRSAAFYGADFEIVPGAGHDVMLDPLGAETTRTIHRWLAKTIGPGAV